MQRTGFYVLYVYTLHNLAQRKIQIFLGQCENNLQSLNYLKNFLVSSYNTVKTMDIVCTVNRHYREEFSLDIKRNFILYYIC